MNGTFRDRILAATLVWGAGSSGCSLLLELEDDQCEVAEDCADLDVEGRACVDGVCVTDTAVCETNKECIDANGGSPYICRKTDNSCVLLLSEDCTKIIGDPADLENDNVVLFGSLTAQAGLPSLTVLGKASEYAIEMVQKDFQNTLGGLPPTTLGGPIRPVAFIACNDQADPVRAAKHLVETVGVPAFIGPITSPSVLSVSSEVTVPNGVLEIAPVASTILLARIPGKEFLFRTSATDEVQAVITREIVTTYAEPWARSRYEAAPDDPVRLTVMHRSDALGNGLAELLYPQVVFNGKTIAENGENYLEIDYGADPTDVVAQADAVAKAVAFKPHIVIIVGTPEGAGVMAQLEGAWQEPAYRPQYVMPLPTVGADYNQIVGDNEDFRKRILVLNNFPDADDPLYQRFLIRYNALFGEDMTTSVVNNPIAVNAYDDAYLLLFAAASLEDQPLTGANLSQALYRLGPPGMPVDILRPNLIQDTLALLRNGENADYQGVSGPVDFAPNGDAPQKLQVLCLHPDPAISPRTRQGGPGIDLSTLTLEGEFDPPCALP